MGTKKRSQPAGTINRSQPMFRINTPRIHHRRHLRWCCRPYPAIRIVLNSVGDDRLVGGTLRLGPRRDCISFHALGTINRSQPMSRINTPRIGYGRHLRWCLSSCPTVRIVLNSIGNHRFVGGMPRLGSRGTISNQSISWER